MKMAYYLKYTALLSFEKKQTNYELLGEIRNVRIVKQCQQELLCGSGPLAFTSLPDSEIDAPRSMQSASGGITCQPWDPTKLSPR